MEVRVRQSGQFADDAIDALAQQPPGVSVRKDGNAGIGAQLLSLRSL